MNRQLEMVVAEKASQVTYTGSGISIAAWIAQVDWAMWTGVVMGAIGLAINWYYKAKEDRRSEIEHQRRMNGGCDAEQD